jgi:hypothetical protein
MERQIAAAEQRVQKLDEELLQCETAIAVSET